MLPHLKEFRLRPRYPEFFRDYNQIFKVTSLKDCDVSIYSSKYKKDNPHFNKFVESSTKAGKKMVAFCNDDEPSQVNSNRCVTKHEQVIMFRSSSFQSRRYANLHNMPVWREDSMKLLREVGVKHFFRKKPRKPVVGFCGFNNPHLRTRIFKAIEKSGLDCNFNLLACFYGGTSQHDRRHMTPKHINSRKRFLTNILNSDYLLCIRGAGNFSCRFEEIMSCGRIPLFVNTNCIVPQDKFINWKKHILIVESNIILPRNPGRPVGPLGPTKPIKPGRDPNPIGPLGPSRPSPIESSGIFDVVMKHFEGMTNEEYIQRQKNCRKIWEEWLSLVGFCRKLDLYL
jgi:hypothetical protein